MIENITVTITTPSDREAVVFWILHDQPGAPARVAPKLRLPPHHAAITSTTITEAQRVGACHGSPHNTAPTKTGSWYTATVTMLISPGLTFWSA